MQGGECRDVKAERGRSTGRCTCGRKEARCAAGPLAALRDSERLLAIPDVGKRDIEMKWSLVT